MTDKIRDLEQRYLLDPEVCDFLENQQAEIERLKACIQDARSLMVDYDGYKTYEGLKILIEQVDFLLMTHKPMERISSEKAGEQ